MNRYKYLSKTLIQNAENNLTLKRQSREVTLALAQYPDAQDLDCNTIS